MTAPNSFQQAAQRPAVTWPLQPQQQVPADTSGNLTASSRGEVTALRRAVLPPSRC